MTEIKYESSLNENPIPLTKFRTVSSIKEIEEQLMTDISTHQGVSEAQISKLRGQWKASFKHKHRVISCPIVSTEQEALNNMISIAIELGQKESRIQELERICNGNLRRAN
jgi:ribosomal protein L10